MYKTALLVVIGMMFTSVVKAEKLGAVCWMDVKGKGFSVSKYFTIDIENSKNKSMIENKVLKLELLFKDNEIYTVMGRKWYNENTESIFMMTGLRPTCVIYPSDIKQVISASIESKVAEAEAKYKAKVFYRNWPNCPTTLDFHSEYNYLGIPMKTKCY